MTFDEILDQVREILRERRRVSYAALKRRFELSDEVLEDLKVELIEAEQVAADENGRILVWSGGAAAAVPSSLLPAFTAPAPLRTTSSLSRSAEHRQAAGERRQLTVEFIDLVGSTTLSHQLDPEDYHARVVAYQTACQQVIARYEGHIAQYLGDGVLVYFGYPTAHEEDAVRAVRSGLEIVTAVSELRFTPSLEVRIGIHTGPVMVGEIGAGERTERLALGETPNLAARVQGHAAPNEVLISATTFRLIHGLFETEGRGPQELKGISTPVSLYRAVGESTARSRFEAAVQTGLTPLVGRAEELSLLHRRWDQAKAGDGQVVLLSGEPGIGKSRLVQELKAQLGDEGVARIEFRCSPYHQNSAFYPVIEHLQRLLQFEHEETPQTKLAKLQQALAQCRFPQADTLPLLASLLSLPHPEEAPPVTLSPQKQKQKTQEALVAWMVEEAGKAAVYCAWEDLHWIDPSSLEVLTLVLDQAPTTRLLALLTFRPEFTSPWGNRSHLSQVTLSRLGSSQVEAMVKQVTDGNTLPPEVVQQIVAKTDGVPLFVEELTKMVMETMRQQGTGNGEQEGKIVGAQPVLSSFQLGVPSTLQDALMARLDRLGSAKEIAQVSAVLGREFSYELLQAVSPVKDDPFQQGLRQLVEAELLYQRGLPPQVTYLFKHALIQDTAYQSLLKSRRQQHHQQIAQVLEERFPETAETQPELLAHHYTEAGLGAQAIPYWQRAGERAIEHSANVEAISHLTKGLEVLKTLSDTPARSQHELALQIALGVPLIATKSWGAPDVGQAYTRALELCQQVGEPLQLSRVLQGLWTFYIVRAECKTARDLGEQLLSLAQSVQDPVLLVEACFALGSAFYSLGELAPARAHLEQGIALYDPQQHRSLAFAYGSFDPGVACRSFVAMVLWCLGYPDQALERSDAAVALAQELSHPFSRAWALCFTARFHQFRRERQVTQERAEVAITLSTEQEFPLWVALGTILQGWALFEQGKNEVGIVQMRQGLAAYRHTGMEWDRPYFLSLLAEAYGKAGQAEEGLTVLAEALATVDKSEERRWEAELYRLKGTLTLQAKGQSLKSEVEEEAEACFHKAIEIARCQSAKSLELRAVMSLARLWLQQGRRAEARQLLAEVYGWFTEGFDTKDLQEAKALLEELV